MKQYILVTGGGGYVGAHVVHEFLQHGYHVVVIDRDSKNHLAHTEVTYFDGDLADTLLLNKIFASFPITAVIHCAASIEVGASVCNPEEYYENNVINTWRLLQAMRVHGVDKIIASSTAAVYGTPQQIPIPETHPLTPLSPYGKTKLVVEMVLNDYAHAYNMQYAVLRYFNAAGATPELALGERHEPETHLIPRILQAAYDRVPLTVFGNDYDTPDGTCIRDYVHVQDLATAHYKALTYISTHNTSCTFNLGATRGYSVQEIITAVRDVTGVSLKVVFGPRRAGDAPQLIADTQRARSLLGWSPHHSDICTIVTSAWEFYTHTRSSPARAHHPLTASRLP